MAEMCFGTPPGKNEKLEQVLELSALGVPKTKIAKRVGISYATVWRWLAAAASDQASPLNDETPG